MATAPIDFGPLIGSVARRLLGEPNRALSNAHTLRWGTHGSMKIDLDPGVWHDKEINQGGGALDLIMRERRCDKRGALAWLEHEGLIDPSLPAASTGSRSIFYDYFDADGVLAYRVERRGKGHVPPFLQHGPDSKGGFHSAKGCMQGVPRLPYRLPELLAADPAQIVFVVEGEKDVDRLLSCGLCATTNSEGAGKFRAELAPHFAGRRVCVIPDNDEAGEAHALDVVAKLEGVAAAAVIVRLPGALKSDVSDWLANGGAAADLLEQAESALAGIAPSDAPETFPIADLTAWASTEPTPKAFFMPHFVPQGEVVIITGDGGTNKSTFALQLAACAAAGKPMLGHEVDRASALYVTAEDDDRENHWRLSRIATSIGSSLNALAGRLYVVSLRGRLNNELATFDGEGKLRATQAYALLRATIQQTAARFVVLDNVAHLFAGNENDRAQVTAFINLLYQICGDFGATLMLIAHRNKSGDNYSGSTAWLNAVRSQIMLERPDEHDRDARRLSLGKANYARAGETIDFRWHDFALVRNDDLSPDVREDLAATAAASGDNQAFLDCLRERDRQGEGRQVGPAPGPNYAPSQFEGMMQARGATNKRMKLAMDRLFALGTIETHTYRNTAKGRDVTVIREVSRGVSSASPHTPNAFPNASRTRPDPTPEPVPNGARTAPHTHSYINISGAAHEAAAPSPETDHPRRHGGMILAPGESLDDAIPEWEDK